MEQAQGAYYIPHGTHWPILGSIGLSSTVVGAALWINETTAYGKYIMAFGIVSNVPPIAPGPLVGHAGE